MQRFENLLSVALADGRLTEREMRLLSERAREWRLDDHQFTVAVNHCLERPGRLQIPDDRAERAELLRDALSVMASDGQLLDAEKRLFAFIAAHAIGQGAVIWVFISEIFPNRHRAQGQALGSATHWVFAALLTTFFPLMMAAMAPGYVFCLFCGMMVLQLIWVKFMVPETKGVPLEEMQKRLGIE